MSAEHGISIAKVEGLPPALDGKVFVKTLSGEEHDAYQERIAALEGEGKKQMRKCAAYIAHVACDAEGAALWTEEHIVKFGRTLILQLFGQALAHNGIGLTTAEAKKD